MTGMAGGPAARDAPPGARDLPAHRWLSAGGASLTAVALLLLSLLPEAPADAVAVAAWVEQGRSLLTWSDELLFFAVLCWGAGARGLLGARTAAPSPRIDVGATALAAAFVALLVVLLAVGRLVYPVFAIDLAPEAVALLVSTTFGAVHLAFLGFAVAAATLTWSTRARLLGRGVGIVASAAFLAGSFPWMMPAWANSLAAIAVAGWGVFLAFTSVTSPVDAAAHPRRREART
ncbi:hypothetical protein [Microbacterium lushaniae]|uniref:DUF4386 family protein n=1 Tax=Microbacterium lushaniae TaxID=2614639 RepID=A0A5J6L0C6_9MICO|nr:hypothetical protein [Microbacterium lushaniae]QEW01836.1 hypothetical protein F6J85_01125 [Microbacterium lushaniae]